MRLTVLAALFAASAASCNTTSTTCKALGCHFYQHGCPCSCNSACDRYGDCCSDYKDTCPPSPPGPHPGPPSPTPAHGGGPQGGPEQIHLSLTHAPSSMVVSFATAKVGFVGATPTCTLTQGSNQTFEGSTHTYTADGWVGLLHTVTLSGLVPSSTQTYTCAVAGKTSKAYSFSAPPAVGSLPVTVAVVGDLGEGCDKPECGNTTIARLSKDIATYGILVHVGDIAYTGGIQTLWDFFFNDMEPIAGNVAYQVCAGNHEHYHNFSGYLNRFTMAGTKPPSALLDRPQPAASGRASGRAAGWVEANNL